MQDWRSGEWFVAAIAMTGCTANDKGNEGAAGAARRAAGRRANLTVYWIGGQEEWKTCQMATSMAGKT